MKGGGKKKRQLEREETIYACIALGIGDYLQEKHFCVDLRMMHFFEGNCGLAKGINLE